MGIAIAMFAIGGVLVLGGIVTVIAGAVSANNNRNDMALAGFIAGGTAMVLSGAVAASVGYLYYPVDDQPSALRFIPDRTLGPTLTVHF